MRNRVLAMIVLACALAGCATHRDQAISHVALPATTIAGTTQPAITVRYDDKLHAMVSPPPGWKLDIKEPLKSGVTHYVWVSPSGNTAFGIMKFSLPLPVPHDPVLWVFMAEMRKSEGAATLISKVWDRKLRGVRFVAEGGRYKVRTNFTIRGLTGWMVYAGTRADQTINPDELQQAEASRELTGVGRQD